MLFADGRSKALLDTIDPATLYALLTPGPQKRSAGKGPRGSLRHLQLAFSSPSSVIDCASGRATITEPTLIEAGAPRPIQPTPKPEPEPEEDRPKAPLVIELPYPYELGCDLRGHEGRPWRDGADRRGRPLARERVG